MQSPSTLPGHPSWPPGTASISKSHAPSDPLTFVDTSLFLPQFRPSLRRSPRPATLPAGPYCLPKSSLPPSSPWRELPGNPGYLALKEMAPLPLPLSSRSESRQVWVCYPPRLPSTRPFFFGVSSLDLLHLTSIHLGSPLDAPRALLHSFRFITPPLSAYLEAHEPNGFYKRSSPIHPLPLLRPYP